MNRDVPPPDGDGWFLAYDSTLDPKGWPTTPWTIATGCDGGFCDDGGNGVDVEGWAPLPDPQPTSTGWRKPEGVVTAVPIINSDIANWFIFVRLPSGDQDLARDGHTASSNDNARERMRKWADQLGLPVEPPFALRTGIAAENVVALTASKRSER
jgi:hypothetical protein